MAQRRREDGEEVSVLERASLLCGSLNAAGRLWSKKIPHPISLESINWIKQH